MDSNYLPDTKTYTLNEILGNGKIYHVPQFQRDYSWVKDQLDDLWNDLVATNKTLESHYFGSIVLQVKDSQKQYLIIDGQQRLATISLLALAIINKIKELANSGIEVAENKERAELLMRQYIGQKDPSSLQYSSKIFLNENNDGFYQQRLLNFIPPVNYNKLIYSEQLLWNAYRFFLYKVNTFFSKEKNGAIISSFLTKIIGEKLYFIQITVLNDINAYTFFETLNSRGVALTATDLLKNYLFSLVSKNDKDLLTVKKQWKKIITAIGLMEFPVFLRHYLNSNSAYVASETLYKSIKNTVETEQQVLDLLNHLELYAFIYTALHNPDDEFWCNDKQVKESIHCILLFKVTLYYPLLMVAFEKFELPEFRKLLHGLMIITLRYSVVGQLHTNEMEKAYNKTAIKIFNNQIATALATIEDLKKLYLNEERH